MASPSGTTIFPRSYCANKHTAFGGLALPSAVANALQAERICSEALYAATIESLRKPTWELAERELAPSLDAALSAGPAAVYSSCVRQLQILVHVHWRLGPERSYAKVRKITDTMGRTGVRKTVAIAIRNYLVDNLLPYGAFHQVIDSDFMLRACDVHSLLDRFKWKPSRGREQIHRLICSALRAIADFRAVVQATEADAAACPTAAIKRAELLSALGGANERLNDSLNRMEQQHKETFSEQLIEVMRYEIGRRAIAHVEQLLFRLLGPEALELERASWDSVSPPSLRQPKADADAKGACCGDDPEVGPTPSTLSLTHAANDRVVTSQKLPSTRDPLLQILVDVN